MDIKFQLETVGHVNISNNVFSIQIDKTYVAALENIEGFSHLQIIWWGHLCETPQNRSNITLEKIFKKGPDKIGVFATRSPARPNPILISIIEVKEIDFKNGIIYTPYIDAEHKTPVLDIKPYHLMERVKDCKIPYWCEHWPRWHEDSTTFDWQSEINF